MAIHKGIIIHQYLDDWLVKATSHRGCLRHTLDLVTICQSLGYQFDLMAGRVRPIPDHWYLPEQVAYQLPRTQSSLSSLTRVPRPLYTQDSTCRDRQHHSGVIHKQGRRHEVGPTLCFTIENLDLVRQKSSNSKSPTHSRLAECGRRQAIQARPDHPNRVVSPSGGLPSNMQQVAPTSNRPICHEVQQQVALVCVTGTGSPGYSSECAQFAMVGSGSIHLPTISHIGQAVMLQDSPYKIIILIAPGWPIMPWFWDPLAMSSQIPPSLPNLPNLLTQPLNQIPHRNLTNLNLDARLLEPRHSRSRASLRRWQ